MADVERSDGAGHMRISWHISSSDVRRVQEFLRSREDDPLVRERRDKNLPRRAKPVTKAEFWRIHIMAPVTTQQPSGPGGKVDQFLGRSPFPLTHNRCKAQEDLFPYSATTFREAGLRFWDKRLPDMVTKNFERMNDGLWDSTRPALETVRAERTQEAERQTAEFIEQGYKGFGPKQSRNLLQHLGLTRFEIPLDSRLTKWLNEFGFPVRLSAQGLSDRNYYDFVSEGIQALCDKAGVFPCVLDAAIFSSFDRGEAT